MNIVLTRIRLLFLAYLVPMAIYWPLVWLTANFCYKHNKLTNGLYIYACIVAFMILSLVVNYICAKLDIKLPRFFKFIFTFGCVILFVPGYIILGIVGGGIIFIWPRSGCYVITFLNNIFMLSLGIFVIQRGKINIVKRTRQAVVVMNHRSSCDYFLTPYIGWFKEWRVMVGANLWKHRWAARFLSAVGVRIERETDRIEERASAVKTSKEMFSLYKWITLLVYGEGTRNREDSNPLLELRNGAFKIACDRGIPILPVIIVGAQKWRRPSEQDAETFEKDKHNFRSKFLHFIKFIGQIFRGGINPTIVKVYYLDKIETVGRTPQEVKDEAQHVMTVAYRKYAKLAA